MICVECQKELIPELAWFICGCGLSFAVEVKDESLDLWCPSGHVYEPPDD